MELSGPVYGYNDQGIENLDPQFIASCVGSEIKKNKKIGFIGGPPCPDFSVAGKNRGWVGENGKLSTTYVDLICKFKPDFFLFENVKGLYRTKKHRAYFNNLCLKLHQAGYQLHKRLMNSIEYGVPQDRDRIILLGFLDQSLPDSFCWDGRKFPERQAFEFEWPTIEKFKENSEKTISEVPEELCVQHWFDKNDVDRHPNAKHCFTPRAGLHKFKHVGEGDDSRKSYKRLHRWRYSPTVAYGNNEVHLHPYKARRITVAEALAIQSLPKIFELPSNMTLTNMFKTVGNGVPFLASRGLAKSIAKHLEK